MRVVRKSPRLRCCKVHSRRVSLLLTASYVKIATLPELKHDLSTTANLTVFRKLKLLDYVSSYTHGGRYYSLREIARFDDAGLWSRRLFAGLESIKLGHGGDTILAEFLGLGRAHCCPQSPATARPECAVGTHSPLWRRTQTYRKRTADIVALIEFLLDYDTGPAGHPIRGLKWSRRGTAKVALALADFGIRVSPNTVARLTPQLGYFLRVNHKRLGRATRKPEYQVEKAANCHQSADNLNESTG